MHTRISIATPADFNFGSTLNSHGWERLEPFSLNKERRILTRIERLPSQLSRLEIAHDDKIDATVYSENHLTKEDKAYVTEFIAYCFAFNWDMSKCYATVANDIAPQLHQRAATGQIAPCPQHVGELG